MAKNQTSATEAQSSESVIAQARALEPTIRKLLEGINAVLDSRPEPAHQGGCHWTDRTDNRFRAYLASVRPMRDCAFRGDIDEANGRGRSFIERLASSAQGIGMPQLRLTPAEVADVLSFIAHSEPVDLQGWWVESNDDAPSHVVGLYLLLQSLEASLREPPEQAGSEAVGMPEALKDHLLEQQTRVAELLSLLERLDEDADQMYTRIAVREAKEIEKALDAVTLDKLLEEAQPA